MSLCPGRDLKKKRNCKPKCVELSVELLGDGGDKVFVMAEDHLERDLCYAPEPYFSFLWTAPLVTSFPLPHHSTYYPLLTSFLTIYKA